MKCYLLLRDNKQTGPHSLNELEALKLKPFDLIWKEGSSTSWSYPTEFSELKSLVIEEEELPNPLPAYVSTRSQRRPCVYVSMPAGKTMDKSCEQGLNVPKEDAAIEVKFEQPLSEIKERYIETLNDRRFKFQNNFSQRNGFWIFGLMIFLLMGAIVVKKIVESDEGRMEKEDLATAIIPIQSLPEGGAVTEAADPSFRNAISKEVVEPVAPAKPVAKKMVKAKDLKKQVKISGNNYKVGLLGGINNLELTIKNNSVHPVDRVSVLVEFLKPGGEVVYTEEFAVLSVAPMSSKKLQIPPTKRGVKVKYRIVDVKSKEYKSQLLKA